MKLKIYIVTFDGEKHLNHNLNSLFNSQYFKKENIHCEVNIINNHSNFNINEKFKNKVSVLHNVLRPDFSTGHLARNWNQAIINGFKNLNNPDCDILIHRILIFFILSFFILIGQLKYFYLFSN